MEYFYFFSRVSQNEITKFNLNFKKFITYSAELNVVNGLFEVPYNRCAYMYKYATCTFSFIKSCMTNFFNECSQLENLLLMWKSCSDLKMCSLSCGPGLDYLAFMLALSELVKLDLQPIFKEVDIVSKSAQWRSTLNILVESISHLKGFPILKLCEKFNVKQDPFQKFSEKHNAAVKNAHVIFMVKTLSLQSPGAFEDQKTYFKKLVNAMETDSILFCIDTKPSVTVMAQVLYHVPGEYLYGPVLNNTFKLPENFPEFYKETYGCLPIISARGAFFVWKKLPADSCVVNIYPSVLTENPLNHNETKSKVENSSSINGINTPMFDVSPIGDEKLVSNVLNSFKEEDFINNEIIKVKKYVELIKNPSCDLKNVDKNLTNSEFIVDKNYKVNPELSYLLNDYYNLNKNSYVHTEQLEETFLKASQDLINHINSKIPQKDHIDEIEYDVSILLSDVCDVVSQVHNFNKMQPNYNPLKNEFCYPGVTVSQQKENELSNHSNSSGIMLDGLFSKNDYKDEKLNLAQASGYINVNPLKDKLTEAVEDVTSRSTFDNCSDISQISNMVEKTKAPKRRRNRKSKILQASTLVSNVSKSSTNSSTSSPIIKDQSELMKSIKLINADNSNTNTSLTNSEKINTELKIPVSNKLGIDSVVNVIPNHSVPKKSVQCGTDSVHKNSNSASIEDLTNRIQKLVTSFETVLTKNQQLHDPHESVGSSNLNCLCMPRINSLSNDSSIDIKPDPQASFQHVNSDVPVKDSTNRKSFQSSDINDRQVDSRIPHAAFGQNVSMECICGIHLRQMHCCANMCGRIQTCNSQMHKCPYCMSACPIHNYHHCVEQRFLHCNHSLCVHGSQNQTNLSVPNIVIPLQNISDDAIAQIIAALRDRS